MNDANVHNVPPAPKRNRHSKPAPATPETPAVDRASILPAIERFAIEKRIAALEAEFQAGQKMLADLDGRRNELQATLLRISGAVQGMRELLLPPADPPKEPGAGA